MLSNTLGLGVILDAKNMLSKQAQDAAKSLNDVKMAAKGMGAEVAKQAERANKEMERLKTGMKWSTAAMGAGAAILGTFGLMVKGAADTEGKFQDVRSLMVGIGMSAGDTDQAMAGLGKTVKDVLWNWSVGKEATEAALYPLVSALGPKGAQAVLKTTAQMAMAAKGFMPEATETMIKLMSTYGKAWAGMGDEAKAKKIANIISTTTAMLNTDMTKMSAAFRMAVPSAAALRVDLGELSATLGLLQQRGMTAEMAGTGYAAMLRGLMNLGNVKGAGRLGEVKVADEAGKLRPIYDIVEQLEKIYGKAGLTTAQYAEIQQAVGDESAKAINLLIGQSAALRNYTQQINTQNKLEEMAAARQKGLAAQAALTAQRFQVLSDTVGETLLPVVTQLLTALKPAMDWLRQFIEANPDTSKWVIFGTAAAGAILFFGGAISNAILGLKMFLLISQSTLFAVGNSLTLLRIRLLAMAIATKIATAAQWLWNTSLSFIKSRLSWFVNTTDILRLRLFAMAVATKVAAAANWIWDVSIGRLIIMMKAFSMSTMGTTIGVYALAVAEKIAAAAQWIWNASLYGCPLVWIIGGVIALGAGLYLLVKNWDAVKAAMISVWEWFKKVPDWALALIPIFGWTLLIIKHFDDIKKAAISVWEFMKRTFSAALNWIESSPPFLAIKALIDGIRWVLDQLGILNATEIQTAIQPRNLPATATQAIEAGAMGNINKQVVNNTDFGYKPMYTTINTNTGVNGQKAIAKYLRDIEIRRLAGVFQ